MSAKKYPISVIVLLVLIDQVLCDGRQHRVKRIVGGSPAQLPPPDDPTVYLRFGSKAATVKGVLDQPHYVFRGIRYGLNPTGKDRFQRPRQYFLEGDIDATTYPPPCIQTLPQESRVYGSEDCLFLNIFTPDLPDGTEGLPVVIWIHGGGFRYGSASQYGARNLVGQQLVIVGIQYRLGTLGFLSTGTPELPGNAALWDMALAVQWVRNYIGFFGGNPHRIVVMGQGTGASSALIMALSSIAKGTVSAVIAMSGTAVSHWAVDNNPSATAREIGEYHGCPVTSALILLKCLQNLDAHSIAEGDAILERTRLASRGFVSGMNGLLGSAPNAEGRFDGRSLPAAVENQPMEDMSEGNIPSIPILTGITKDETKKAVMGKYYHEIVDKLKTVPNFLDNVFIKNLQSFTGLGNEGKKNISKPNIFSLLNPLQFRNYIKISKNNLGEGLHKIAEATSDALFHLPAFLTVDFWKKKNVDAYLYRFEHIGQGRKARHFLNGLPILGNDTVDDDNAVGHGDDLGYIFEARNLDGTPLDVPENLTSDDLLVREKFTKMIAEFARTGKVQLDGKQVDPFNGNNFIQIDKNTKVSSNFRFCEMALWAGITERLKSSTCSFLNALDTTVRNVENAFFDTVNDTGNKLADAQKTIGNTVGKINPFNLFQRKRPNAQSGTGRGLLSNNNKRQVQQDNDIPPIGFLG